MSSSHSEHGHDHGSPFIQHHFDGPKHQFDSGKLGIWLFLVTEVLFFSGLFVAYIIYRAHHPEIFDYANHYLDTKMGAINTAVLLFSSLTAAWAVRCAQLNQQRGLILCLSLTLLCAFGFLGIKTVEYKGKYDYGTLWGAKFDPKYAPDGTPLKGDDTAPDQGEVEDGAAESAHLERTGAIDVPADLSSDHEELTAGAAPPAEGSPEHLLRHDGAARHPRHRRRLHLHLAADPRDPRAFQLDLLRSDRLRRAVLAPGRPDLDLPVSASVFDPLGAPVADHSTKDHAEHDHDDHGLSHVTPVRLMITVFVSLLALTWITVAVTTFDLGYAGNIILGMFIASIKATLVALYFMHLRWEKPINVIVATSGLLFALLFVAITLLDRSEYLEDIVWGDDSEEIVQ
jgi:caa(3)-type oxidase subunit IV